MNLYFKDYLLFYKLRDFEVGLVNCLSIERENYINNLQNTEKTKYSLIFRYEYQNKILILDERDKLQKYISDLEKQNDIFFISAYSYYSSWNENNNLTIVLYHNNEALNALDKLRN